MSVFFDISAALDQQLNSISGGGLPSTAWPNIKYEPVQGRLWIRPTHLPASTFAATIGAGTDLNTGLYQIDIFGPADEGKNEAQVISDTLADLFERDTVITYNSRTVIVKNTSQRYVDTSDGWFHLAVDVEYYSFTALRS